MAQPTTTTKQSMQIAAVITTGVLVFNGAFFFLSNLYFGDHAAAAELNSVRLAFAILTVIIAVASFTAALAPRMIGHALAVVLGFTSIVGGLEAFAHDMPGVLGATLLIVGVLMPVLAWQSFHHSRAAWAFLIALTAVFGGVDFFGAPKVRGLLGIGLWTALIMPGLQIITVIALAMVRGEYADHETAPRDVLGTMTPAAPELPKANYTILLVIAAMCMWVLALGAIEMHAYTLGEVAGVAGVILGGVTRMVWRFQRDHQVMKSIRDASKKP